MKGIWIIVAGFVFLFSAGITQAAEWLILKPSSAPHRITSYNVCYTKLLRVRCHRTLQESPAVSQGGTATRVPAANGLCSVSRLPEFRRSSMRGLSYNFV